MRFNTVTVQARCPVTCKKICKRAGAFRQTAGTAVSTVWPGGKGLPFWLRAEVGVCYTDYNCKVGKGSVG